MNFCIIQTLALHSHNCSYAKQCTAYQKKSLLTLAHFCEWAQSHTHTQINSCVNPWSCITHINLEIQTALHTLPLKFKQLSPWLRPPLTAQACLLSLF